MDDEEIQKEFLFPQNDVRLEKFVKFPSKSLRTNSGIFLPNSQTGDESKTILFSKKMKHYISYFILFPMFN